MHTIFNYTDYRKYLKDWYDTKKEANHNFSYRIIADKVGFKSAGHFTMILQGKANISLSLALRFADYMKLKKRQTEYFEYMVLFNQAKKHEDKKLYFEKMGSFKESAVYLLHADQYAFYEKWYHAAIRAILDFYPFKGDYGELAKMLIPSIAPSEAQKSIELLEKLEMVSKNGDGYYQPREQLISTGYDARSVALNNFLINSLLRSKEAVDRFPKEKRNMSCLTLGISQRGFDAIQQELREFRRKVMGIAEKDSADTVFQFSLQLFPLSHKYRAD
ncbi:MAG: TIGR02147 family protein [Chitinivibrionales bacterium]|nr:TIGR02147 family protein [Chitinivibrionales bacterium]